MPLENERKLFDALEPVLKHGPNTACGGQRP